MKLNNFYTSKSIEFVILFIGLTIGYFKGQGEIIGLVLLSLVGLSLFKLWKGKISAAIDILIVLLFLEPFNRVYIKWIPYLFYQYLIVIIGLIFLTRYKQKPQSLAFILFLLYFILELLNGFRFYNWDNTRQVLLQSSTILSFAVIGISVHINNENLDRILNSLRRGSLLIAGIILARYISGGIEYTWIKSTSEATNGLAPVQISFYLSLGAFCFFIKSFSTKKTTSFIFAVAFFTLEVTLMLLSFSRGGLYFLGILIFIYFILSPIKVSNFLYVILFIPLALGVYSYVTRSTNGLIIERYAKKGTSGRDLLVKYGWEIFKLNPIIGIGTGNYYEEVSKEKYYGIRSGAHNEFIRSGAENGILGLIFYFSSILFLLWEIFRKKQKVPHYYLAIIFVILFCMVTVHNGLKLGLQSFLLFLAIGMLNSSKKSTISST